MKNIFTKIINTGVHSNLEKGLAKRIKVTNFLSVVGTIIAIIMVMYSAIANLSLLAIVVVAIIIPSQILPIIINRFNKFTASRVYLILWDNLYLVIMSILFGPEMHYQYFSIVTLCLPIIFFKNEISYFKWVLSIFAIVCWLYTELHHTIYQPFFLIEETSIFYFRIFNDLIIFITILLVCYVFVNESEIQLDKIKQQTKRLSKSNAQLEQFAYIVSHDLKEPIRHIQAYVNIIDRKHSNEFNEELDDLFSVIKKSSKRMKKMITSIFKYSTSGTDSSKFTSFNLTEMLDKIVMLIEVPENINFFYDKKLPTIYGSFIQLNQVLTNLINNAIKYNDNENGFIRIKVKKYGNLLKIEVSDNGPGIKPIYQTKIFEMFGTANEVKRNDSSGIGLNIVSKLVELNQGEFGLESKFGEGSNFWFTWPLKVNKT